MKSRRLGQAAVVAACSLFILIANAGPKEFWETKPYTEWNAKEVEKLLLKESPWTRVLLRNQPSSGGSAVSNTGGGGGSRGGGGGSEGGPPAIYFNWYSKPIRQAVVRQMMLNLPNVTKEQLDSILNHKSQFYEVMVSGYTIGAGARGRGSRGASPDNEAALAKFKEDTYLQKKGNSRIPLVNLVVPRTRNAAYFLQFAKEIDGKPSLTAEDKEVTLVIRVEDNVYKYKFKLADMMIGETLEL
jgi:hypothetical protein